ncbi:MAG: hypothetical protein IJ375_00860 [Oscillospiraceae bacterium]|nr:hypothetical protein [Oscillospiraceae bacterium]
MMKALLVLRLRDMLAGLTRQSRQKSRKGRGMLVLFAVLYLYVGVVLAGMMCMLFGQLALPYHMLGLDWLYFAMAGLYALGLSIFGGVFTTQSQLYDAKDNDLLLSMPIKPGTILLSRLLPLLLLNLLFAALVMVPASVMYAVLIGFSPLNFLLQLLSVMAVTLLSQAICCLLGWGLHLLLRKVNKSLASLLYMAAFLGLYFYIYSQAGNIMNSMATEGAAIASALESWVWPICALGRGCNGEWGYFLLFAAICAAVFGLVYWILSKTFLRSATFRRSSSVRKLDLSRSKAATPAGAIIFKEWRHFLGSPVYLTNMSVGILLTAALAVAGVILRGKLLGMLEEYAVLGLDLRAYLPLILCALLAFLSCMNFVSAPSVSLEGRNLWILKAMPLSGWQIISAKLKFHCLLTTPVAILAGLVLSAAYGCGIWDILLCALIPGVLSVLCGLVGMVFGLKWARLEWLSEAYPCKQGAAVGITMFAMMGVPAVLAVCWFALRNSGITPTVFLTLALALLCVLCFGLYRLLKGWGVRKWDSL